MHHFYPRTELSFQQGDNSTDVVISGAHFNRTTLDYWNYTLYDNNTLSNGSECFLTFSQLHPVMLSNGTFINATTCYFPWYGIRKRGSLGIVFACFFAASIMFTLVNLRKHGRLFLPNEKRFHAIGRRWQWYWMLFVAVCGIVSCVSAVDVDRDYLQSIAIILQNLFFYLMMPGMLATVWEGVRHWGSWQERQLYDRDPFSLRQDDRRSRKEFYMPLIFYLLAWLNFFMNIPRNWTPFEAQSTDQQVNTIARPNATDSRFKAGAFLAFAAWCMICISLQHSIYYYKPRNRGIVKRFAGFFRHTPLRFLFTISLLLVVVVYAAASSFLWELNLGKLSNNEGWLYGLGYGPIVLTLLVNEIFGVLDPNEDRALIRQRVERGHTIDAEIGYPRHSKPWWWDGGMGFHHSSPEQRLKDITTEIGGGRATGRNLERQVELGNMPLRPGNDNQAENPFMDREGEFGRHRDPSGIDNDMGPGFSNSHGNSWRRAISQTTVSTTASQNQPQQVKSMLDV